MKVEKNLRPIDLARAAGISTQTVRDYERLDFLPAAERGPQGYRQYGPQHLQALHAAQQRLNELSEASCRCAEATAAAWEYIHYKNSEQI